MLAMKNPSNIRYGVSLAYDEISNEDGYYLGVKNDAFNRSYGGENLIKNSFYLHTLDPI